MIPPAVKPWLSANDFGAIIEINPVGGGCINQCLRLVMQTGQTFILKTNRSAPVDLFAREAEGLQALSIPGGPRAPKVYLLGGDFILLEDLSPAPRVQQYWEVFGAQLATMHLKLSSDFGFEHDNYLGSTPQPNPWMQDGFSFFFQHRLGYQAQLAYQRGLLDRQQCGRVEKLASQLESLIPKQPASLIHGDLWSGNMITDESGYPAIIDPAAYYGWAEAELAMMELFGSLPETFYMSYQAIRPLEQGFRQRYSIYNLYHLLNHLNLFGRGYFNSIIDILKRFT